jgi:hypothetical protein
MLGELVTKCVDALDGDVTAALWAACDEIEDARDFAPLQKLTVHCNKVSAHPAEPV